MNSYNPDNYADPCDINPGDPQCYTAELGGFDARQEYIHGVQDWNFDQTGPQNWIAEAILQDARDVDPVPVKQGFRGHPTRERMETSTVVDVSDSTIVDVQPVPASALQTTEMADDTLVRTMSWNGVTYAGTPTQMVQITTQNGSGQRFDGSPHASDSTVILLLFIIVIAFAVLMALPHPSKYNALLPHPMHENLKHVRGKN